MQLIKRDNRKNSFKDNKNFFETFRVFDTILKLYCTRSAELHISVSKHARSIQILVETSINRCGHWYYSSTDLLAIRYINVKLVGNVTSGSHVSRIFSVRDLYDQCVRLNKGAGVVKKTAKTIAIERISLRPESFHARTGRVLIAAGHQSWVD